VAFAIRRIPHQMAPPVNKPNTASGAAINSNDCTL
jgi:hypothetical protein